MLRYLYASAVALLALVASPAHAGSWHGDWLLSTYKNSCMALTKEDSNALLLLDMAMDGSLEVYAYNPGWSYGRGERLSIVMAFSNGERRTHSGASGTIDSSGMSGFGTRWSKDLHAKVLRNFSEASFVDVTVDGGRKVRFGLKGTSEVIPALQRCAGNVVLPGANTLTPDLKEMLQLGNSVVGYDSRRWAFNRLDPNSGWTIARTDFTDDVVSYRMHYTFNRGMRGWVDIRQSANGTCLAYWDRQNICKRVEVF